MGQGQLLRCQPRIGDQRFQPLLRLWRGALSEVGGGDDVDGVGEARLGGQHLQGRGPSLVVRTPAAHQVSEAGESREVVRLKLDGFAEGGVGVGQATQALQDPAACAVGAGKARGGRHHAVELGEGLGVAFQARQAKAERIAGELGK